jgi:hypothetical protein
MQDALCFALLMPVRGEPGKGGHVGGRSLEGKP